MGRLQAQVEVLTKKLGPNSKSSHLPPSSDGPGKGSAGKSKKKSKRKRSGQPRHCSSHRRLLPLESVDEVVDFFPEVCLGCSCARPKIVDRSARWYQLLDLCDHRVHVMEFRRHEVECPRCRTRTRVEYDPS